MKSHFIFLLLIGLLCSCGNPREISVDSKSSDYSAESSEVPGSAEQAGGQKQSLKAGQITAAEWNDLNNWEFWETLLQTKEFSSMPAYWNYNLSNRIAVHISNAQSENMADMPVELITEEGLTLWRAKTDHKGNVSLWPSLKNQTAYDPKSLSVKVGDEMFKSLSGYKNGGVNQIVLTDNGYQSIHEKKIDIAFMVDATGSMGDELEFLKAELTDVIAKVKTENELTQINTGTVFYRDQGEAYVTRKSGFTSDIQETVNFIKEQSAEAGGDFPEAVEEALSESVMELQWSSHATARLLFIILDAPPHHGTQINTEINRLIETAAAKGITVIPVTASGIDKETEFLMRYMAIATNGSYVFITNDSGIGNDHLVASVGNYQVEYLNALMVRIINERLK